jgi:hypothetical protein
MLPQELAGLGVEQTDKQPIPLHIDEPADPARRRAIIGGLDLDAAIRMHRAFAVLVIAEGIEGQREQRRPFLGEHRRNLAFGGAVDPRVGPTLFPAVQVGLRFLRAFEAESFQRRLLRMSDATFHLSLSIRISHAAGHGHRAVVRQHVAVERIESRIVNVRGEHTLAQVIEDHSAHSAAQAAKRLLVEFGPGARARMEDQQADRLAAVAERHHEQPHAPVLAAG